VRSVTADLLAGAVAGLAVAMPVGAIGAYLLGLAARERFSMAATAALGVASVDGAYALVASLGGAGLRALLQRTSTVLTVLAALVLVGLAIR
jgi:threonine/homoserine/homoserine lactone efflux protein